MRHQKGTRSRAFACGTSARTVGLTLGLAVFLACPTIRAQEAPAPMLSPATPMPMVAPGSMIAPGTAVIGPGVPIADGTVAPPVAGLSPETQIVRFQGPPGLSVEVLAPEPTPVPIGDGGGILTVGLQRGVGYRLRIANIPERPGAELFPVIEVVGHLHRPDNIDPSKYPIRIEFTEDDLYDVVDRARLVTKVIYLEDPDQAIPFKLPKDHVFVQTLNPSEPPLTVAAALGRPVAIVRIGGRKPTPEEINGRELGDLAIDWVHSVSTSPCPFLCNSGAKCSQPCGPVCVTVRAAKNPVLPRDEYLCDGGDRGIAAAPGDAGRISGIEPRDAVIRFDIGLGDRTKQRILPTNIVCVYAPRFAEVRIAAGTNQNVDIQSVKTNKYREVTSYNSSAVNPRKLVQNQAAELARLRERPVATRGRTYVGADSNSQAVSGYSAETLLSINLQKQSAELARNRQKPAGLKEKIKVVGIKTAEGPLVTGFVQGANEAVKVIGPQDLTGIETPPDRPGLAVVKRVSATEAEPGDKLTYVIFYRNMGNTPIRSVAIVDSLLPRLEYVKGTSRGIPGTAFSTAMNKLGSTELRWELPGVLKPGEFGHVSFDAIVR